MFCLCVSVSGSCDDICVHRLSTGGHETVTMTGARYVGWRPGCRHGVGGH